eukprot:jgi/Tetstr1/462333/TSEL_007339.t1
MDDSLIYRINLLEILADEADGVPEPPDDAAECWSVDEIKAYFSSGGTKIPTVKHDLSEEWCRANNWLMLAVQPPGRAMRLKEPFVKSSKDLAQRLLPVVAAHLLDTPYMVVAHSVGTWNAFEFLMHARAEGVPMPMKAFLSGFPGPDIPFNDRPWQQQHKLQEHDFKDECREWDINSVIFSEGMWPMYQPILRADFTLFDQDRRVNQDMVERWSKFTSAAFTCLKIEGNHLWPLEKAPKDVWLKEIEKRLDVV